MHGGTQPFQPCHVSDVGEHFNRLVTRTIVFFATHPRLICQLCGCSRISRKHRGCTPLKVLRADRSDLVDLRDCGCPDELVVVAEHVVSRTIGQQRNGDTTVTELVRMSAGMCAVVSVKWPQLLPIPKRATDVVLRADTGAHRRFSCSCCCLS